MSKSVKAIYEDGVFKPLEPVTFTEHQQVVVSILGTEKQAS
jgi:predicted DNA-binding antitoxin AbrB/MazE fold protein